MKENCHGFSNNFPSFALHDGTSQIFWRAMCKLHREKTLCVCSVTDCQNYLELSFKCCSITVALVLTGNPKLANFPFHTQPWGKAFHLFSSPTQNKAKITGTLLVLKTNTAMASNNSLCGEKERNNQKWWGKSTDTSCLYWFVHSRWEKKKILTFIFFGHIWYLRMGTSHIFYSQSALEPTQDTGVPKN